MNIVSISISDIYPSTPAWRSWLSLFSGEDMGTCGRDSMHAAPQPLLWFEDSPTNCSDGSETSFCSNREALIISSGSPSYSLNNNKRINSVRHACQPNSSNYTLSTSPPNCRSSQLQLHNNEINARDLIFPLTPPLTPPSRPLIPPLPQFSMDLMLYLGDLLCDGRYRVLMRLGSGGLSTVWLAQDTM